MSNKLEDDLLMWSWGRWAREGEGKSYPAWVVLMLEGYRETGNYLPPITDDYAMKLDRIIATLEPKIIKKTVFAIYYGGTSLSSLSVAQRRSKVAIAKDRDYALAYIQGALAASQALNAA